MRSFLGIFKCDESRSITEASVGIQCTGGFANMSGGKSGTHEDSINALEGGVLVGTKCVGAIRIDQAWWG